MATLYFDGAVDGDWDELGNWWQNAGHTTAATALPTSSDSVVLSATCSANSGSAPTVVNLTASSAVFDITIITVTGMATFSGGSTNFGTVTGNATFNDSSVNEGTVTGDATFNDSASNSGTVTGNGTFNDYSNNNPYNSGTVTGNATFNDSSGNASTVTGNATFNDSSGNSDTVDGNATFSDSSVNIGSVSGDATFNGNAYNEGFVSGDATFTASSFGAGTGRPLNPTNAGSVFGTITFSSATPVTFTLNDSSWDSDATTWVFTTASPNWTFFGLSTISGAVNGDATFNDDSYNAGGGITGNATFNDTSYNNGGGFINGTATYSPTAARRQIESDAGYINNNVGSVVVAYEKGINGSSILGVV